MFFFYAAGFGIFGHHKILCDGSSDLGGDPSDDEPPSLTSASPSEDDDPEDPENPSDRKKKKKRKSERHETRSSKEAKANATSEIAVNLPEFTGKDLSEFAESFLPVPEDDWPDPD